MASHVARILLGCWLTIAATLPANAQLTPVEVTFQVPLNVTRLPFSITRIRVWCELQSNAIRRHPGERLSQPYVRQKSVELAVSQGEVAQTVPVVFSLDHAELDNPSGKQATYKCDLHGFNQVRQIWTPFKNGHGDLILTPVPATLSGQFVW